MYQLTASIVTYHTDPAILRRCLDSLLNAFVDLKIYVVDNSSQDTLRSICAHPAIAYVFPGKNLGYGAGHNIAMKQCLDKAPYHLVLNPDVYFGPEVLPVLLEVLKQNSEVGLVMPKVLYPDGSIQYLCRLLPGPIDLIARRFVPIFARRLLKARAARYELRNKSYDTTLLVPHLSGCFMLMSANALKKVGLFDERFFMYLEDVDLSRRMHRQFLTIYYPRVFIFHEFAKGSYSSWKLLSHHVFSAIRFFNKWGWLDRERSEVNSATLTQNEPRLRPIMPTKPSERETHLTPSS